MCHTLFFTQKKHVPFFLPKKTCAISGQNLKCSKCQSFHLLAQLPQSISVPLLLYFPFLSYLCNLSWIWKLKVKITMEINWMSKFPSTQPLLPIHLCPCIFTFLPRHPDTSLKWKWSYWIYHLILALFHLIDLAYSTFHYKEPSSCFEHDTYDFLTKQHVNTKQGI